MSYAEQLEFEFEDLVPRVLRAVEPWNPTIRYNPNTGEQFGLNQTEVNAEMLDECLKFSVPIRMFEMRNDPETRLRWKAKESAVKLAVQGDGLTMGDTKPGRPAGTFEALATLLAIGALASTDGATYRGNHWCRNGRCVACVTAGRTDRGIFEGGGDRAEV